MEHFIREQYKCSLLAFYIKDNLVSARVFMDDEGFYEDAATGSANGDLAAYLVENKIINNNQAEFVVQQGVEMGRPSKLYVGVKRNIDRYMIKVGGKVVLVAEGNWCI